jgi:hypothetical protein
MRALAPSIHDAERAPFARLKAARGAVGNRVDAAESSGMIADCGSGNMGKIPDIGLKRGRQALSQMGHEERLSFIAEGLPLILASSRGFWDAARALEASPREAEVLEGFAKEEAAKILILMDAVRCPAHLLPARIGKILRWFYDHHARLIFAEAASWKPVDVAQLRDYVKPCLKSHYVEGYCGEYILPNWSLYRRESQLYVDIEERDDSSHGWSTPLAHPRAFGFLTPTPLEVAEAMSALGLFTVSGLMAVSEIWGRVPFSDKETHAQAQALSKELLERVVAEGLPGENAENRHVSSLYDAWQLPMYDFDLKRIEVSLEELRSEQDRILWNDIGW